MSVPLPNEALPCGRTTSRDCTVLLTGASTGIGFQTARLLAARRCTVIVHARSEEESADTYCRLIRSDVDVSRLYPAVADFSDLRQVTDMATAITALYPRVDVLVNNAATAGAARRVITRDGHERTWQIDYLAPYLLTRLLEDTLARSEVGRVVNVSSTLHRGGRIAWNDLSRKRRYTRTAAYAQAKLALTMLTTALAESRPKVREAVSIHPGVVATGMLPTYGYPCLPAIEGAHRVARLADPGTQVLNGAYYDGFLPAEAAEVDRDDVQKLWDLSERLTRLGKRS